MTQAANQLFPVILPVSDTDKRLNGRDKVKALSRLARSALMKSCEKSGLHLEVFPKNEKGVPLPVDGVHWSLTHKSEMVGGVASLLPVGMDLETIRPVNDALLAKVADDDEWQLVGGDRAKGLFPILDCQGSRPQGRGEGHGRPFPLPGRGGRR